MAKRMPKCQQNKMKNHHQFKLHRQFCKACHLHNFTETDYKTYMTVAAPIQPHAISEDVHNMVAAPIQPHAISEDVHNSSMSIHVAAPIQPPPPWWHVAEPIQPPPPPAPVGKGDDIAAPIQPPPPPAPAGKEGGMRPPPGLNHLPVGKGGAGPLADLLADTRRRVEDIEHDQTQIQTQMQTQIQTQADDQTKIQTQAHQIAAMEAKFVLLEVQINTEHRASFDKGNEMMEQITNMENRVILLEAASNSASLSSSTAADYEVLKNPSLLKP
jgi:hypothetical protein